MEVQFVEHVAIQLAVSQCIVRHCFRLFLYLVDRARVPRADRNGANGRFPEQGIWRLLGSDFPADTRCRSRTVVIRITIVPAERSGCLVVVATSGPGDQ